MAHRLAVDTRGDDVGSGHAGVAAGRGKGFRVDVGQREGSARRPGELVGARCLQCHQLGSQRVGEGQVGDAQHAAARGGRRREIGDDGVDSVEAGAGHDAGVDLAAHRRAGELRRVWRRYSAAASRPAGSERTSASCAFAGAIRAAKAARSLAGSGSPEGIAIVSGLRASLSTRYS